MEATTPKTRWYLVQYECEDGTKGETRVEATNPARAVQSLVRRVESVVGSKEGVSFTAKPC